MWMFLSDGFLSIVAPTPGSSAEQEDKLIVRARCAGDIRRAFPEAEEEHLRDRDRAFRAAIAREAVAEAMRQSVSPIRYTNFKDSVAEEDRHDAYVEVWRAM